MTLLKDLLKDLVSDALMQRETAKENSLPYGDKEIDEIVEEYLQTIKEEIIG